MTSLAQTGFNAQTSKPDYKKELKQSLPIYAAAGAFGLGNLIYSKLSMGKLPKETIELINSKIDDVFAASGLKDKGVTIAREAIDKKGKLFNLKGLFKKSVRKESFQAATNTIHFLKDNPLGGFHEIGHALDWNFGKLSKQFLNAYGLSQAFIIPALTFGASVIGITATIKNNRNKKNGRENKNGIFEKVQKHYPKLVALAFIPMIVPEVTASLKAHKLVSKVLPKNLLKKMNIGNAAGLCTYVASGILAVATAAFITKGIDFSRFKQKTCSENKHPNSQS